MGQTPYLNVLWELLSPTDAVHAKACCNASPQWRIDARCLTESSSWIGTRLIAWPAALRERRLVGVVSSRIGRRLDQHPEWFAALRSLCDNLNTHDLILSAENTTTGRFLDRCQRLWHIPVARLQLSSATMSIHQWFDQLSRTPAETSDGSQLLLSPPLKQDHLNPPLPQIPLADRVIGYLSHQLHVLHLRRNGNWDRLLRTRLSEPCFSNHSVFLSTHSISQKLTRELSSLGAVTQEPLVSDFTAQKSPTLSLSPNKLITALPTNWTYLAHCTRRCDGPWPDQSEEDYLDSLLLGLASSHRSPLSALSRIVQQRRLIASAVTNRAGARVVSFTEVPLAELPALRTFRPHRARWDFEPYGICIERQWLTRVGTKPVTYGENATWSRLTASERPFFQKSRSDAAQPVDWTIEKEWRHIGDVNLQSLPQSAGLLFVPHNHEAVHLASFSPWPVLALDTTHRLQGP